MSEFILEARDISVSLGHRKILENCSLSAKQGEFIGIIGPNGAGKSTFLKAVRGMIPRSSGEILIDGKNENAMHDKEIARKIAFMQQEFRTSFSYTAKEIVMSARYPYLKWWQKEDLDDEKIAEKWMTYTGVIHLADKPVQTLSGGERQRVILAKVLAQETPVLFLDEPTASLDLQYQEEIFRLCRDLANEGKTIIMICHDLMMSAQWCSRLLLLSECQFTADGIPVDVLTENNLKKAFRLDSLIYNDPISDRLALYTYKGKEEKGKKVLVLGDGVETVSLMRHLFLSGYQVSCGPLGEKTLARATSYCFHIPYARSEEELEALMAASSVIIDMTKEEKAYHYPETAKIYTADTLSPRELQEKADRGEL